MPKYIAIAAITMDGRIARHSKEHVDWTSPEDKEHLRGKMRECDVIVLGNNTYQTSKEFLLKYSKVVFTKSVSGIKKESDSLTFINANDADVSEFFEKSGYKNVCVLGGSQVYSYFLKAGLIDEIWLTIEPKIFGSGINLFNFSTSSGSALSKNEEVDPSTSSGSTTNASKSQKVDKKMETREYKLVNVKQLNQRGTVLLHYTK